MVENSDTMLQQNYVATIIDSTDSDFGSSDSDFHASHRDKLDKGQSRWKIIAWLCIPTIIVGVAVGVSLTVWKMCSLQRSILRDNSRASKKQQTASINELPPNDGAVVKAGPIIVFAGEKCAMGCLDYNCNKELLKKRLCPGEVCPKCNKPADEVFVCSTCNSRVYEKCRDCINEAKRARKVEEARLIAQIKEHYKTAVTIEDKYEVRCPA